MKIQIYGATSNCDEFMNTASILLAAAMSLEDDDGTLIACPQRDIELEVLRSEPWWRARPGTTVPVGVIGHSDWRAVAAPYRMSIAEDALLQLLPNERFHVHITPLIQEDLNVEPDMAAFQRLQDLMNETVDNMGLLIEGERIPATSRLWSLLS